MVTGGENVAEMDFYTVRMTFKGGRVSEIIEYFASEKEALSCMAVYERMNYKMVVSKERLNVKIKLIK
jgi:hypothetical protein